VHSVYDANEQAPPRCSFEGTALQPSRPWTTLFQPLTSWLTAANKTLDAVFGEIDQSPSCQIECEDSVDYSFLFQGV
jgi:hypothetical protein